MLIFSFVFSSVHDLMWEKPSFFLAPVSLRRHRYAVCSDWSARTRLTLAG